MRAGHEGECFCENPKEEHKCNQYCEFYNKALGCSKNCNLPLGHKDNHLCEISKENHLCKGLCYLDKKTRGNCLNNGKCCLPFGHNDYCKCSENHQHLCNENCSLFGKAKEDSCNKLCNLIFGHSGEHLCDIQRSMHICPNACYYYNKCKGKCNYFCSLSYGHNQECICNSSSHLCDKECSLYGKAGGCNKDCSLIYGHIEECICNVNNHTCMEKCRLCENVQLECGHIYNHNNKQSFCNKCKSDICQLFGKGHLCGGQHNCPEDCEIKGWCEIECFIKQEEQIYTSQSGEEIKYYTIKFQEIHKKKCNLKIPMNQFSHVEKNHNCGALVHKCGYKCLQCEYCCTENYGHTGLHNCLHGNIKNSYFSVSDFVAKIKKDNREYKFIEGETAKIFFCDEYCREQGQGHTHLFDSDEKIIENENVKLNSNKNNKFIYECKCSYYWENILKFKCNFTSEEQKKFSLCNWKCKYESHQLPEFCQLPLWHDKVSSIPTGIYGTWISQGHVFKCLHPLGVYSIFLVDQSGSMNSESEKPTNNSIRKKMNNMLGASIQAIDDFCNKREKINPKDKIALIGFNNTAITILENSPIDSKTLLEKCLQNLKPEKGTHFINAFKAAKTILETAERKEHLPIVILLTDGLDHHYDETKKYLKDEVSNIFIYLFILIIVYDK